MAINIGDITDRVLGYLPRMRGKSWEQASQELDRVLRKLWHAKSGIPGGFLGITPNPTGKVGDPGTAAASWRAADAIVPQGIVTDKGDLLTHDGVTAERLPVGANDLVLVADSTEATGLRWATVASLATLEWAPHVMMLGGGE